MSDAADKRIAELERELRGTQEMLAFILKEVGKPVVLKKATVNAGLPDNAQIQVDDNQVLDAFVFSIVEA